MAIGQKPDTSTSIPPTYWFCLEMMADPEPMKWLTDLGVDLKAILHARQDFSFHTQAKVGDWVTFHRTIVERYSRKGGMLEFVVKKTRVLSQANDLIVEFLTTVAIRHAQEGAKI